MIANDVVVDRLWPTSRVKSPVITPVDNADNTRRRLRVSIRGDTPFRIRGCFLFGDLSAPRTLGQYALKGCVVLERRNLQAISLCVMALSMALFTKPAIAAQRYRVIKGDSLWLIARKFSTSAYSIKQANNVRDKDILPLGKVLIIPCPPTHHKKARIQPAKANPAPVSKKVFQSQAPLSRSNVVQRALAYRGSRYRRGGISRGGFDCSGFTRFVYKKEGIVLPHSSSAQFSVGKPVSRNDLRSGDLVFFRTRRGRISHVGIYMGDGRFVHASNHRGGVKVDSLHSSYYAPKYCGARRVR